MIEERLGFRKIVFYNFPKPQFNKSWHLTFLAESVRILRNVRMIPPLVDPFLTLSGEKKGAQLAKR